MLTNPLTLEILSGPPLGDWPGGVVLTGVSILGRGAEASVRLADPTVSRRHAEFSWHNGRWLLTDLGSRHGVQVNGVRIEAGRPVSLSAGDRVRIGPWTLALPGQRASAMPRHTILDRPRRAPEDRAESVQTVPAGELQRLAEHRLEVLLGFSSQAHAATDLEWLGDLVARAASAGSGCARAALLEPDDDGGLRVLGFAAPPGERPEDLRVSGSLVEAARAGQVARLAREDIGGAYGQSIASLDIHSALCAPVTADDRVDGVLYLDARGSERRVEPDAAAFCQAVARIAGMAWAQLRRREREDHWRELERDLNAARAAQEMIWPKPSGVVGAFRYAMRAIPGREVAGDLFDVVPLAGGRVAAVIGDVTGKGVGAALAMAVAQTRVRIALETTGDPAAAASEVNRALLGRMPAGRFVTLLIAVLDPDTGLMRVVDAGHGLAAVRLACGTARLLGCRGSIPVGLDAAAVYQTETVELPPEARLVLCTDGVVEQADASGAQLGVEPALAALASAGSVEEDIEAVLAVVRAHAGPGSLADDLTVASIGRVGGTKQ